MKKNIMLMADYYKIGHAFLYPKETNMIYSTWTPRSNNYYPFMDKVVLFGLQYVIKEYLIDYFNDNFFNRDISELIKEYKKIINNTFSDQFSDTTHWEDLHKLGYLPIQIDSVPEGTLVPLRVPMFVIYNTHPNFFWLPQFLENIISSHVWKLCTNATKMYDRRSLIEGYLKISSDNEDMAADLGGDFSFRGMSGEDDAYSSGASHLLSFNKTATIGAIEFLENYYNADVEKEIVGLGTPSLEHAVVETSVAYYKKKLLNKEILFGDISLDNGKYKDFDINLISEYCFLKYLLTECPNTKNGVLSYVSDTYDFWGVVTRLLPLLKEDLINRKGVFIVRPDSGDPVDIVCGEDNSNEKCVKNGLVETLMDIFGYEINSKGYKVLSKYIKVVYGDAINRNRLVSISEKLISKGISVENIYFGFGSYSFNYSTRDEFGFALKATSCHLEDTEIPIYKEPKGSDFKASQRGRVFLYYEDGIIKFKDGYTDESMDHKNNLLKTVFKDGKLIKNISLSEIRDNMWNKEK